MFVLCHMSPQFWSSDPAVQSPDILHPWGRLQDEEFSIRGPCKFRRLSHWQDRTTLLLLTVLVRVMAGSRSICCASYPRSGNHDNAIRLAKLRFKTRFEGCSSIRHCCATFARPGTQASGKPDNAARCNCCEPDLSTCIC